MPWLALAALAAALFLPGLGSRDLWNPDEPRYAEVSREMRENGAWALPHVNGEVYSHKPPLQFWAINAAATLRGTLDETAVRLPAATSAILAVLAVYGLGRILLDPTAAFVAAAAFATCAKILWQGRIGQIDMLLTMLVTAAMLSWVASRWRGWTPGVWLFYVLCGLATLAKGPVGFLPPLLAIVAFLFWQRDREGLRRLRVGRGVLVWAAVVLAWLVPAGMAGGETYLRQIVLKQNLERYADPWHHFRPVWYYLTVLPGDFFPWFFLLPGALFAAWKLADHQTAKRREALRLAICWVTVTIVFFSISPAKRTVYILTMYPGLALLVGAGIAAAAAEPARWRRWFAWPLVALGAIFAVAVAVLPRVAARREELTLFPADTPLRLQIVLATAAVALIAAGIFAWRGRLLACAGTTAAGMAVVGLALVLGLMPLANPFKSLRRVAELVARDVPPGERWGTFAQLEAGILFYSHRTTEVLADADAVRDFLARGNRWVVADKGRRHELDGLGLTEHPDAAGIVNEYTLLVAAPAAASNP